MMRRSVRVPRIIALSRTARCAASPAHSLGSPTPPRRPFLYPLVRHVPFAALIGLVSCSSAPWRTPADDVAINVGRAEIFENADLQQRLDQLKGQLAALTATDQTSLTAAINNNQGVISTQSGVSLKIQIPGSATAPDNPAPPAPSAPTSPTAAPAARTVLENQLQLSSQITGYTLLLSASDFARYTNNGAAKDHIVVGFPISINPGRGHRDQAAEVRVVYYPPNASQFEDPKRFVTVDLYDHKTQLVCSEKFFSPGDPNAPIACLEQEQSPTIITLLPNDTGYNTANISSNSASLGVGAVIGTVNVGASAGHGQQTQYIRAAQDTIGMEESEPQACQPDALRSESGVQCVPNSRGVAFRWQFRPVLGERTVRTIQRLLFVQLAIPYAHRPYPNYGGIVEIQTRWLPFDTAAGLIKGPPREEKRVVRTVFGHPFMSPVISNVTVKDLGSGSVLVGIQGKFLIGATVRIGSTVLNNISPGFLATYNALQFTTTALALAQNGAVVTSSSGVDTPITAASLCKAQDSLGECYRDPSASKEVAFKIKQIRIDPISDTSSQVRIELGSPIALSAYPYHHYFRSQGDVVETTEDRKPLKELLDLDCQVLERINTLPILVYAGGKAYGFSDLPLQYVSQDESTTFISFAAANDSLNNSPQLKVQRLFGDPESDSAVVSFVPMNAVSVAAVPPPKKTDSAPPEKKDPAPATTTPASNTVATHTSGATTAPTSTSTAGKTASTTTASAPPTQTGQHGPTTPPPTTSKPPPAATPPSCNQETSRCEYLLSGASVNLASFVPGYCEPPSAKCRARVVEATQSSGSSVRRFTALQGTKQVSLQFRLRSSLNPDPDKAVTQTLTLALATPPSPPSSTDLVGELNYQTPAHPNFSLVRSVMTTHQADDGTASITVGVQKLKDQTATLTVIKANIESATDSNKVPLAVLPGGQVTVTQDTQVTFKLRDADLNGVNVTAEGKNGTLSTGKVSFKNNFVIVPPPSPAKDPKK
jgi:hypothetical protein